MEDKQFKYRVPMELNPGVFRAGVGFFSVGQVVKLPDKATMALKAKGITEKWNKLLEPLDKASYEELKRQHGGAHIAPWPEAPAEVVSAEADKKAAADEAKAKAKAAPKP